MKYLKVWTDFLNVLEPLQDAEIGRLFVSMLRYADTGTEPGNFAGNERFLWAVAKRDIDIAADRAETLRQNGSRGGRPKTKENQQEPIETKQNQSEPEESRKEKKRNEKKGNEKEKKDSNTLKRFDPPTVEEVAAYCRERRNNINAEYFVAYYAKQNWYLSNGRKMSDWKMAVITWERRDNAKKAKSGEYSQRDYSTEDDEAMQRMIASVKGVANG